MKIINDFKKNIDPKINRYSFFNNVIQLDGEDSSYILKRKFDDELDVYKYLKIKGFSNFVDRIDEIDNYNVYPYIKEIDISSEDKAINLVYLMSVLHNKTTYFSLIDQDKIKELYEETLNKIMVINNYYDNIRYIIEVSDYLRPSMYLLLRNITFIYVALDRSKYFLEKWFNIIQNKKRIRRSLVHNNLELSHLIEEEKSYIVSWDKAKKDYPIYDFLNFYKNCCDILEFTSLFDMYNSKYNLFEEERYLLFSLMLIPEKVEFKMSEVDNTIVVSRLLLYLENTFSFISKYDPNYTYTKAN